MTTKPGGTEKPPTDNEQETVHLITDHEIYTWCRERFVPYSQSLADVTCLPCLKAARIFGEGATERLRQIELGGPK